MPRTPDYTPRWGLPKPKATNFIASDTQNLRQDFRALADKTEQSLTQVEHHTDTKYGDLPVRVKTTEQKTAPIRERDDTTWNIIDATGQAALGVTEEGDTQIGSTVFREADDTVWRIVDETGAIALEVIDGTTFIYDFAGSEGGSTAPRVTDWHVFLAVGQSNMSGSGLPYSSELDVEDPRILQYGAKTRSLQPATVPLDMHDPWVRGMSPATGFAQAYLRHQPAHVGVVLVPAARSGTAFTDGVNQFTWRPNTASAAEWDLYGQSVQQTREALEALGDRGQLKGILWHQGEGNSGMTTETYAAELDNLITHYRTDLGDPGLPFVVGQMAQERIASHATRWQVDRAHTQTPARVQRTGFAPSSWGWASYDETHFGRPGALGMGENMVAAYWQAVANTNESQLLPPLNVTARRVGDTVTVTWDAPPTRVTSYQIRTRPIGGTTWDTVARDWPMHLSESFTATEPVEIEVTAHRDTETSTIVLTQA